uniref:7TM_GPCR_Srx domain-containing protein n=1 Tax=Rhabditophanes sp. KR3021 TaxID=114890 RepID=A0AC35TXZ2_9BILA
MEDFTVAVVVSYGLVMSVGLILNTTCIYLLIKLTIFKNCFGYMCLCLTITKTLNILLFALLFFAHFQPPNFIDPLKKYVWAASSIGNLFLTINRLIAVKYPTFYYKKFKTKVSVMYTFSIYVVSIILCLPYLKNDCIFYYDLNRRYFIYVESFCKFYFDNILTRYISFLLCGIQLIIDIFILTKIIKHSKNVIQCTSNSQPATSKSTFSKEHIFAFQCIFGNMALLFVSLFYTLGQSVTEYWFNFKVVSIFVSLIYLATDTIILISFNSEIRKTFTPYLSLVCMNFGS